MSAVTRDAPAKVNLTLEVLGRRHDGYHELASVFAAIDLIDRVRVAPSRTLDVRVVPDVGVPPNEDLSARALRALAAAVGREPLGHVRVRKRVPVAAGLGGGSSDAGATLRALTALWKVDADLVAVGAGVGSDVPFFAAGARLALVRGRGERVLPLEPPAVPLWICLVTLPVQLATAAVFGALRERECSDGRVTVILAEALADPQPDPARVRGLLRNDLTAAAERVCREIAETRFAAATLDIELHLSGSGPSLFALADDRADAIRIARRLKLRGFHARPHQLAAEYR